MWNCFVLKSWDWVHLFLLVFNTTSFDFEYSHGLSDLANKVVLTLNSYLFYLFKDQIYVYLYLIKLTDNDYLKFDVE